MRKYQSTFTHVTQKLETRYEVYFRMSDRSKGVKRVGSRADQKSRVGSQPVAWHAGMRGLQHAQHATGHVFDRTRRPSESLASAKRGADFRRLVSIHTHLHFLRMQHFVSFSKGLNTVHMSYFKLLNNVLFI